MTTLFEPEPAVDSPSDLELLRSYLEAGRHAAFNELVLRYQDAAYRVAFMRTGNREQAEEAVQEAFLKLAGAPGRRALTQPDGLRFWFLALVSNVARSAARTERRALRRALAARHRSRNGAEKNMKRESPASVQGGLDAETRETLTQEICMLDEEYRLPLVLHYLGDLNQAEIAKLTGIHQSSVSRRIEDALAQLRLRLQQAGVGMGAVALPVLLRTPDWLEAPASLKQALAHPGFLQRALAAESMRLRPYGWQSGSSLAVKAAIALCVLAAGAAGWFLWASARGPDAVKETSSANAQDGQTQPVPNVLPEPASARAALNYTWDFHSPEAPKDIQVLEGRWRWVADGGPDGKGCMETDGESLVARLPVRNPPAPLRVTLVVQHLPPKNEDLNHAATVGWERVRSQAFFQNAGVLHVRRAGRWCKVAVFVTTRTVDTWMDRKRTALRAFEREEDGGFLLLYLRGPHRIEKISLQEAEPKEVPDVTPFLAALGKIPPAQRTGRVVVPELKSLRPPAPVEISFGGE